MRRIAVALVVAGAWALAPISTYADDGLTSLVNAAYFPRTPDASLHELAHERAQFQVVHSGGLCGGDGALTHVGLVTAEVLACNFDGDPVSQWLGSATHNSLLLDRSYNLIGCGSAAGLNGAVFYTCVLASSPVAQPTPPTNVPAPPAEIPIPSGGLVDRLPNTAVSDLMVGPAEPLKVEPVFGLKAEIVMRLSLGGSAHFARLAC